MNNTYDTIDRYQKVKPQVAPYLATRLSTLSAPTTVPPEKVHIGSLILGRGGVNQYCTRYFIDRRQQQGQAWFRVLQDCLPCIQGLYYEESRVEGDPGKVLSLKTYVEDVEQAIYEARHVDNVGKRREWRFVSGGITYFLLLITVFLVGTLKVLMEAPPKLKAWMTLAESFCAIFVVLLRTIQVLILYWREREERRSLEVTAWEDGTVTRGRPLSLFILMWVYGVIQAFACCVIVSGSILLSYYSLRDWTILSNGLAVFIISEFTSALVYRNLENWKFQVKEDHLKLTLLEASDLFEDAWRKTRDDDIQNRVYKFKEAIIASFRLDTLRLAHIRKWPEPGPPRVFGRTLQCQRTLEGRVIGDQNIYVNTATLTRQPLRWGRLLGASFPGTGEI